MNAIDPELLEILVCPENKQPVNLADPALVDKLNEAQRQCKLLNRFGKPVREAMDGGLIREDHAILYPIIDGIPVMLTEEGIPLAEFLKNQ